MRGHSIGTVAAAAAGLGIQIEQKVFLQVAVALELEPVVGGRIPWPVTWRFETCQNCAMLPSQALASKREQVLTLAAAQGARGVRVFGSVAKGLDKEGSDLDLLVDLPPGTSLLRIVGLKLDIEDALGVKVDLCTESELHPDLKTRILAEALPL